MSQLLDHHKTLTNGFGKCSVPMWRGGRIKGKCQRTRGVSVPAGNVFPAHTHMDSGTPSTPVDGEQR